MNNFLRHVALATLAASLATFATASFAQSYPAKPIRIIVPYAPGGSTDVLFRIFAPKMPEVLGQQAVIDNRPGAASTIGLDMVAKSPPDGYTIGVANIAYGANPSIYKKMPFDSEKDLAPVGLVSIVTMVLSVHPSIPARSVKEYIALAKARPGTLNYGSAGNGSANHLATARFAHMANINVQHVPYKGGGPAVIAITSGEVSTLFATIPSAIHHFKSGRLRALGVSSAKRNAALPELPTIAEAGVPGFEAIEWQGLMVPAGTPREVITRLNQAFARITAMPDVKERVAALGSDLVAGTPEEFDQFVKRELTVWSKVVKEVGIKID
ncbi:MAG TPA: tripartite tricarboxylate transporter substrate binding protein [Burkholderiales bacterium]|nr:tripartite tricarboxylate transporter substrate binding protein [Burkholderiales bacterium]